MTIPRCAIVTTYLLCLGAAYWLGIATSFPAPNVEIRRVQVPVTPAAQLIVGEEIGRICRARERSKKTVKL